jgi:hypothetical protein
MAMVWALIEPGSFGDFFPDGDFVGRKEQLAAHFSKMSADFQAMFGGSSASYKSYVSSKFANEIGTKIGEKPKLVALEPHEKPSWFETEKRYTSLGSIIETSNQLLAVDEALKTIIERLDPGVHDFWPMQITMPKGEAYPNKYYALVIGQFKDSFSPENSAEGSWTKEKNYDSYSVPIDNQQYVSGLALSNSAGGVAHLWRERKLRRPNIWFSDSLQSEIAKAGLRLPKHYRAQEVA